MRSLEQLDRWIAGKVKGWATRVSGQPPHSMELLEMRREILEHIRDHIEPTGDGRSVFPYRTVTVHVAAPTEADYARLDAAFAGPEGLESDVRGLFAEARCPTPVGFAITFEPDPTEPSFRIDYIAKAIPSAAPEEPGRPAARISVIKGSAEPEQLEMVRDRINLGRLAEVVTEEQGLRRRNDIAFADSETTVSREHAYIAWDREARELRIYDTHSARGTSVFRDGRRLEVTRGTRGLRLEPADEIHLGKAQLRIDF